MTDDNAKTDLSTIDTVVDLAHEYDDEDVLIMELVGADVSKQESALHVPILGVIETKTRTVRYRQADGFKALDSDKLPHDSHWIVADPRLTLKRALELHRDGLLYFHRKDHTMKIAFMILPVWQSREQSVRLLVRKPMAQHGTG